MTSETLDIRVEQLNALFVKRVIWVAVLFLLNGLLIAITAVSLNMAKSKYYNNPLFDYQTQYQELLKGSRTLISDHSTSITEFKVSSKFKKNTTQEDPSQLLIRDMIYLERDFQDFIIFLQLGMKDFAQTVGGIDEWYFFQRKHFRSFISNSRKRQKVLRGMLKKKKRRASNF